MHSMDNRWIPWITRTVRSCDAFVWGLKKSSGESFFCYYGILWGIRGEAFWAINLTAGDAGTLTALIASYSSPEGLFWAKLSAASTLACAPIIVFGWFCQKQLVQGLTFGAVK